MEKKGVLFFGLITLILAIDGFTGRWLPNIIEHIGAGFLIPLWSFEIIDFFSKKRFKIWKESCSIALYLTVLLTWEKNFNQDFVFGIIGMILFLIYINRKEG